jgi:protein-L-isoaspartate(D-aspartate) O-methyltransferase
MARVPRELFVPEDLRQYAYEDGALPIGHGQTISQPFIVATICALLGLSVISRIEHGPAG